MSSTFFIYLDVFSELCISLQLTQVLSGEVQPSFNCSAYMELQNRLMVTFETVMEQWPGLFNATIHCLANSVDKRMPALMEIDGFVNLIQ